MFCGLHGLKKVLSCRAVHHVAARLFIFVFSFCRPPLGMAIWSFTCVFIASSSNRWIRALYPLKLHCVVVVVAAVSVSAVVIVDLFCVCCRCCCFCCCLCCCFCCY